MLRGRWRLLPLVTVVGLLGTGCLDQKVDDADVDGIRTAVENLDGSTVLEVRVRDELEHCCGLDLVVRSEHTEPDDVRRQTRTMAKMVWLIAPPDEINGLSVTNLVGPDGCDADGTARCWSDYLEVSAESARRLWQGKATDPPPAADVVDESCPAGPDLAVVRQGFQWDRLVGFAPDLTATLRADYGHPDQRIEQAADEVAQFVWNCYPAALSTFTLTIEETVFVSQTPIQPNPTDLRSPTFTYPAADLRTRFGPRPADLPG